MVNRVGRTLLTSIAPILKSAYVSCPKQHYQPTVSSYLRVLPTTANSMLFPKLTATRSPFSTPICSNPRASALLFSSSSRYVNRCFCALEMTAFLSPYLATIDAKF
jgi:hypothetical protein